MDTIFIKGLRVRGRHGVYDEERAREQGFLVDMAMDFDTRKAAQSDDIRDTLDYHGFRVSMIDIVKNSSFKLLERLADSIANKILEDVRVSRVSITVQKEDMYEDCTPGVTVVRTRV